MNSAWLCPRTYAARHPAARVRLVRLDAIPDGSPCDDDAVAFDPAADRWEFAAWPGVEFHLPLDV